MKLLLSGVSSYLLLILSVHSTPTPKPFFDFPRGGSPLSSFGSTPFPSFGGGGGSQWPSSRGGSRVIEIPIQHYNSPSSNRSPNSWFNSPRDSFFDFPSNNGQDEADSLFSRRRPSSPPPSPSRPVFRPSPPPPPPTYIGGRGGGGGGGGGKTPLNRGNSIKELNSGARFNPRYSGGKFGKNPNEV